MKKKFISESIWKLRSSEKLEESPQDSRAGKEKTGLIKETKQSGHITTKSKVSQQLVTDIMESQPGAINKVICWEYEPCFSYK